MRIIIAFLALLVYVNGCFGQTSLESAKVLVEAKKYQQAAPLLLEYLKQEPNNTKAIELLGDLYGYQESWDKAIKYYSELVALQPQTANYHYKYGGALGMKALTLNKFKALGIIGDVKKAFLTAAALDPQHIDARWALVQLYMKLPVIIGGGSDKALKYANELETLSAVDGYLAKGYIYKESKAFDKAEFYYQQAVELGKSVTAYTALANLYITMDNPQEAIKVLETGYKTTKQVALLNKIKAIKR